MAEQTATTTTAQEHERDAKIRATIVQIEASWDGLMRAIAGIPDDRLTAPGAVGEWSVKDVMGHVAYWDEQAVAVARRRMVGTEPGPPIDWQTINEREAATRAGQSLAAAREELRHAHERVMETLRSLLVLTPADAIGICGCLTDDTYEHYDEHASEIRAWRERIGV